MMVVLPNMVLFPTGTLKNYTTIIPIGFGTEGKYLKAKLIINQVPNGSALCIRILVMSSLYHSLMAFF